MFSIKRRYAGVNVLTMIETKKFWTLRGLVRYLFKGKKTVLGTVTPYGFFVRAFKIDKNGQYVQIEFTNQAGEVVG